MGDFLTVIIALINSPLCWFAALVVVVFIVGYLFMLLLRNSNTGS